jgi:hypothetical protein
LLFWHCSDAVFSINNCTQLASLLQQGSSTVAAATVPYNTQVMTMSCLFSIGSLAVVAVL